MAMPNQGGTNVDRCKRVPRSLHLFLLLLSLALVVAACGTAPDEPAAEEEPATETEPAPADDPEEEEPDDDGAGEDEPEEGDGDTAAIEEFYSGNTVTLIVATDAGGGFDTYARLIARHMGEHIPGNPQVIVENMPGAGHMIAMNHVYNAAPDDGTVVGNATGGLALEQLFGSDRAQFDMREYEYLGMPDQRGTRVLIVATDRFDGEFEDLLEPDGPELVIGGSAPGSVQLDPALLVERVVGANVRVVDGFDGSSDMRLAMEQGEIDAMFNSYHTAYATDGDKFDSGEWRAITKFAEPDEGDEDVLDVPSIYDFVDSEEDRDLLFFGAGYPRSYTRIYFTPPGTPQERHDALEEAFQAALADEDLLAEAEQADIDISPISGDEVKEAMTGFLDLPEEQVERLREALFGG